MDYLHKTSTSLLKRSNESIISVGDIDIESIINKNRKIKSKKGLVKSFYSSSLGIFKQMIFYKGIKFNKEIILVNSSSLATTVLGLGTNSSVNELISGMATYMLELLFLLISIVI